MIIIVTIVIFIILLQSFSSKLTICDQYNIIYNHHNSYQLDTSFHEYLTEVYHDTSTITENNYMRLKRTSFFYRNTNTRIIPIDWSINLGDNATNFISYYFAAYITNKIHENNSWIEVSRFSSNMFTGVDRKWDEGLSHGPFIQRLVPYGCWFHSTPGELLGT